MSSWIGTGAVMWEHTRRWELPNGGEEYVRAAGALVVPGGFDSLSFFFRRSSQTTNTVFEMKVWTAPVYFKPLDDLMDQASSMQYLFPLALEQPNGLVMDSAVSTSPKVFAARLKQGQPMGTLLFWSMLNSGTGGGHVIGDFYVVGNHIGTMSTPRLGRPYDSQDGSCGSHNRTLK